MPLRTTPLLVGVAVALASTLASAVAPAQVREHPLDRARIRYGISLQGGALSVPGITDLGVVGVGGQLGLQVNRHLGIYYAPGIDFVSGPASGLQIRGAVMFDLTLAHVFTIGIGPDIAGFAALGADWVGAGVLWGGRLHVAVNPLVEIERGGRRHGLTIGIDLPLYTGGSSGRASATRVTAGDFVAAPVLSIGYKAF